MGKYKAVLWDLDGTLIASPNTYYKTLENLCDRFSFSVPKTVPAGACLYTMWDSLIHQGSPQLTFENFLDEIHDACLSHLTPASLRDNIGEVVLTLNKTQFKQACVSNGMAYYINEALMKTEIAPYFEHWIGRDNVAEGKPSPVPYLTSSLSFKIEPTDCLVIEDTPLGVDAAKRAGMTAVAFPNEHSRDASFSQADYIVEDIRELYELLGVERLSRVVGWE
ncbi:MAG: hypothetical protein BGO76_07030 [Caedibacter sp. 38-128]|nr:HAD family phosphatase [Holosporales bacterium]OJX04767.1 MAG: hypothetical protein BGO76_07030 [Caedibacter sp. 38-128]